MNSAYFMGEIYDIKKQKKKTTLTVVVMNILVAETIKKSF